MDDTDLDYLFSGDLDRLVELPKRVVRLFISSTFTDMTLERNSLMERVYPRLKQYCRENHGLDFQVVDMRWGVRDEATDDHQTVNLCSREIRNCQRMSLGPTFVALLGDKYGFRPLCNRIKSTEYRALRRCLIELDINTDFLDTWYKEDLNAVPAEYLLQPISSILKNFTNKNEPELQSIDQRIWQAIQERLHELLMIGSSRLVKQGRMTEQEQLMKYSISVTEREVIEGCLDLNDAKLHCLVYVRSISNLQEHLERCLSSLASGLAQEVSTLSPLINRDEVEKRRRKDSQSRKASLKIGNDTISLTTSVAQTAAERKIEKTRKLIGKYIDLISKDSVWSVDEEAQIALNDLREVKLESKLKSSRRNFVKFAIPWNEQEGVSLKSDEHKRYVNDLTNHFYTNLTRMIRRASKNEKAFKSGLIGEVLQHSHYARHVSKTFHGRTEELAKIRSYILNPSTATMFIYGVGGSGKTSTLARAATLSRDWILSSKGMGSRNMENRWDQKPCIIMRFCGTTPNSSTMVGVLTSVCSQLQFQFYQYGPLNGAMSQNLIALNNTNETLAADAQLPYQPIPEDFVRLVFIFRKLLDNCQHRFHSRRTFLIILDSLERLSSPAESSLEVKYSWLTSIAKLPPNVRLIVSCSSEKTTEMWHEDYRYLKRHFIQFYSEYRDSVAQQPHVVHHTGRSDNNHSTFLAPTVVDKSLDKFDLLKKILIPMVRLKKGQVEERAVSPTTETRIGWSLLSRKRRSSIPEHRQARAESNSLILTDTSGQTSRKSSESQALDGRGPWILHIRPLGVELALNVIKRWLADNGRNLTQQQWSIVEKSFAHCSRPIFVKLALGEIVNWKSYSIQSDTKGLTFGSSLLSDQDELRSDNAEINQILKMLAADANNDLTGGEEQFKRQILSMEQQWLNYLDYRQREDQKLSNRNERDSARKDDGTLIIRVGAVGGTKSTSASRSGSITTSICYLSNTIDDAICQLFARIELQHGYVLTKHSLSYITAARNGICENELEDLLSLDDVVLDDVFQYHLPPVRRIPPLLWTRIRNDLPDYLSERDADGIVINWHHSQFKQVTRKRYLSDSQQLFYIHSNMADYFLGRWADKAKPFRCTKQQIQMAAEQLESAVQQSIRDSQSFGSPTGQRRSIYSGRFSNGSMGVRAASFGGNRLRSSQYDQRLQIMQAKADRRVPHQPLYYTNQVSSATGEDGDSKMEATSKKTTTSVLGDMLGRRGGVEAQQRRRYNLRKLTELPHHLMRSGRFLDLANHVLFNYKWLFAALEALGLQCVLSDFSEAHQHLLEALDDLESGKINTVIRRSLTLEQDLELRGSGSGGSQNEMDLTADSLRSMIRQLEVLNDTVRLSCSAIYADTQMLAPQLIGRLLPLVRQNQHQQSSAADLNYLSQLLEQCDKDGCADCALLPIGHCLQSPDGLQLSSLEGHSFAIMSMCMGADQRHLLAVSNKFIMWDITTGQISRDVDPKIEGSIMRQLQMGANNEYALAYTSDSVVLVLDILTQQVSKWSLPDDGSDLPIIGLDLIDRYKATRFVVWTSQSWYVLRVINNELDVSYLNENAASSSQRISLDLQYAMDLSTVQTDDLTCDIMRVQSTPLEQGQKHDLAFLETYSSKERALRLITVSCRYEDSTNQWLCESWPEKILVSTMALDPSSRQLVYCSSTGDLFLRRRRNTCWSRPKLIRKGDSSKEQKRDVSSTMNPLSAALDQRVALRDSDISPSPLAVELDLNASSSEWRKDLEGLIWSGGDNKYKYELAAFERQIDALRENDEIEENTVFDELVPSGGDNQQQIRQQERKKNRRGNYNQVNSPPISTIKLYLNERIVVVKLATQQPQQQQRESCLLLPKNIRNISVQPNRCQIRSIVVSEAHLDTEYLVAAVGRRLLLYSLTSEQFLKSVEAHNGRIVQLIPVHSSPVSRSNGKNQPTATGSGVGLSVASASLDKTVKIWDLSKVDRQVHSLDRLSGAIESLRVCPHRPLAAALSRGELGLWDWRSLKLVARLPPPLPEESGARAPGNGSRGAGKRVVRCEFSANGRYLAVATLSSIHLYSLDGASGGAGSGVSSSSSRGQQESGSSMSVQLKLNFDQRLAEEGTVRRLKFFYQDSRLLLVLVCRRISRRDSTEEAAESSSSGNGDGADGNVDGDGQSGDGRAKSLEWHLARRLLIVCLSVPDGRALYSFESLVPLPLLGDGHAVAAAAATGAASVQIAAAAAAAASGKASGATAAGAANSDPEAQKGRLRLPALTRDQQHLVAVEWGDLLRSQVGASGRRKSSAVLRPPVLLKVYSTRDGQLEHSIDLSQLESYSPAGFERRHSSLAGGSGAGARPAAGTGARLADNNKSPQPLPVVSITGDQFTHIKAVPYLDRQTVVALLNEERDSSFLVDVQARQLMGSSSLWNGKSSSDGRFGLSRMFKTTALRQRQATTSLSSTSSPSSSSSDLSAGGLQLLEMRRCQPIKSLLTGDTLARLAGALQSSTGSDSDIKCGFTKPNDAYVYFHDARLARLLLVRLADSQLIANYKLSSQVGQIKCSADGYALLLAQSDGSLTSLALVDAQRNDTLTQLAQYPSRRRSPTT